MKLKTPETRITSLNILRSLAIILVFFSHYEIYGSESLFPNISRYGWVGVDLFFVLSGFLIASQLLKPITLGGQLPLGTFYRRRAFRILPSYLAIVALYFLIPGWRETESLEPLWKFLTFTLNFGLNIQDSSKAFSHAWSLCVEEHFYLLLPVLVLIFAPVLNRKRAVALLLGIFVFGLILRSALWLMFLAPNLAAPSHWPGGAYYKWIYYPTFCRLDGLLAGVALASIYRFDSKLWTRLISQGNRILALGVVILIGAGAICYHHTTFWASVTGFPLVDIGFACLLISGLSPQSYLARLHIPGSATMANLAFTFYLVHKEIIHLVHTQLAKAGWSVDSYWAFGLSFLISLLAAVTLHILIERPFLRLRDRLGGAELKFVPALA